MKTYYFEIYVFKDFEEIIEVGRESASSKKAVKQKIIDRFGDRFSEFIDCYEIC